MINKIEIFNFEIHFYSLCILFGIFVAYFLITKEAKKHNINQDFVFNLIFYGILVGILGARIYYVIFNLDYYLNYPIEIIKIWNGGLAIHGGIIFGLIFVYFYSKRHNINFLKITDIIVPGLITAQALGRWGNFFNQEAYGMSVSKELLNKLLVPNFIIDGMYFDNTYYLPTFWFESIWCILGLIILLIIRKNKRLKVGVLTGFYFVWYSFGRFIIEIFRTDSLMLGVLKQAQVISVIGIIIGIILMIKKNKMYYEE